MTSSEVSKICIILGIKAAAIETGQGLSAGAIGYYQYKRSRMPVT
jgi:hypothetical protein